jgi:putative flippase GtrA
MRQLLIYLLVGGANTLFGLSLIFALKFWGAVPDAAANACGYAAGMALSFVLNKTLTFSHPGDVPRSALRFVLVQGVAYLLNLGTVMLLIRAGVDSYLAQSAGVLPYTAAGFLGSKYFAFRRPGVGGATKPAHHT